MTWHNRLTQARLAAHMSKSTLAKETKVSPATVTMWENGDTRTIDGANLLRVCSVLNVSPEWLLDGSNPVPASVQGSSLTAPRILQEVAQAAQDLQWVTAKEALLLSLFRGTDLQGQDTILSIAKIVPRSIIQPAANES